MNGTYIKIAEEAAYKVKNFVKHVEDSSKI